MPAVKPAVEADKVNVPFPVPLAGESVSHAALSVADHDKVPPPVLLIFKVWAAGLLPPCWAENDRLVGLIPMFGGTGAAETVTVTGIVTVEVPVALMERVAL